MWQQGGLYPPHCLAGRAVDEGMGCGNKVGCTPRNCLAGRAVDEGMGCGNKVVCTPLIAWLVELLMRAWDAATRWSVPPSLPGW